MKSVADYKTPILMQLLLGSAFLGLLWKRAKIPGVFTSLFYFKESIPWVMSKRVCHASVTLYSSPMSKHILPHALQTPAIKKLEGKRIVLASSSPRRKEILKTFVRAFLFPFRHSIIQPPILRLREVDLGSDTRYRTLNIRRGSFAQFFLGYTWISGGDCFT